MSVPLTMEAVPEAVDAEWHKLDPKMLFLRPLHELPSLLPLLIGMLLLGNRDDGGRWWAIIPAGLIVLMTVLHWFTARYRITDTHVEMRSGLITRKHLSVPRDRIRTVDLTAKPGHRVFGLSAVRVGTGQHNNGKHHELVLDAVSSVEAERLRQLLLNHAAVTPFTVDDERTNVLASLQLSWLRFAPLTMAGLVILPFIFGPGRHYASELHLDPTKVGPVPAFLAWLRDAPVPLAVLAVLALCAVLIGICSLIAYVFSYWNYQLSRETDGTLRVRRGLITKRSISIAEDRLRGVHIVEVLSLRAAGGAKCSAVATGLNHKGDSTVLLPAAPRAEAHRVARAVLGVSPSPTETPLVPHPRSARLRRITRALVPTVVAAGVLWLAGSADWLPTWSWIVPLVLLPFAALVGVDRYRNLGHALTERYLVTRSGSLSRHTTALQRTGIIGWRVSRSLFQRRAGLVSLGAITAAGKGIYHVMDLNESDAVALADRTVPDLLTPFLVEV